MSVIASLGMAGYSAFNANKNLQSTKDSLASSANAISGGEKSETALDVEGAKDKYASSDSYLPKANAGIKKSKGLGFDSYDPSMNGVG